jgi:hypothetical protein
MFGRLRQPPVEPGLRFCQRPDDRTGRVAEVLFVDQDARGIPHVHFRLTVEPTGAGPAGRVLERRILALAEFRTTYPVAIN